jgi:hypothetical protein
MAAMVTPRNRSREVSRVEGYEESADSVVSADGTAGTASVWLKFFDKKAFPAPSSPILAPI